MRYTPNPRLDLTIERIIAAPRAAIWSAWTDAGSFEQWWVPAPLAGLGSVDDEPPTTTLRNCVARGTTCHALPGRLMRSMAVACLLALSARLGAQDSSWNAPFPAFRIAGNLYYVGTRGLASYLVTSPRGHILINSDLESNVTQIKASVEQLGFRFRDIRILLISHAHWDHSAGSALVKRMTGASYSVMEGDVSVVESGGKTDFHYGDPANEAYPAAKVDRVLHDGDTVSLGGTTLVARLTPGHTKGCTTWTMKVREQGRTYDVVIVGSPNVNPGYRLVDDPQYPAMAEDFARTFRVLESLPVDIFLGAHGTYFDMEAKYVRWKNGDRTAFVDRKGYRDYVNDRERAFRKELAKQRAAHSVR